MIEIGDAARPRAPEIDRASGGFAWWYVDLIDGTGDGAVLIWSYGLPFLPGYADAARRGRPERPVARPSVNVVAYRGGRPVVYLLQEHPEADADAVHDDVQQIGGCRFRRTVEAGRLRLDAELDCALPGTRARLRGRVRVEGVARGPDPRAHDGVATPHLWTPLSGPATGEATLRVGGRTVAELRGRAYHDRNGGEIPLHELEMQRWLWSRVPLGDRERIVYLLWPRGGGAPRCIGLDVRHDGSTEHVEGLAAETEGRRWNPLGPWLPATLRVLRAGEPWLTLNPRPPGDVGPFYLRSVCDARTGEGERSTGWMEVVQPDRVDLALHRPFVRMRVHRAAGPNSPWVPLFTGPRRGRLRRLVRHLIGGVG
jgi:hypothetical protein